MGIFKSMRVRFLIQMFHTCKVKLYYTTYNATSPAHIFFLFKYYQYFKYLVAELSCCIYSQSGPATENIFIQRSIRSYRMGWIVFFLIQCFVNVCV